MFWGEQCLIKKGHTLSRMSDGMPILVAPDISATSTSESARFSSESHGPSIPYMKVGSSYSFLYFAILASNNKIIIQLLALYVANLHLFNMFMTICFLIAVCHLSLKVAKLFPINGKAKNNVTIKL